MKIQFASKQHGVTLLESLLGILLFSIGILAVVALQTVAVRTVAESKYRMDASFLADEVIGQMWTNRPNLASYEYNGGAAPTVLAKWVTRVQNALPGVAANPPVIDVTGNVVTVTIFWQHPEEAKLSPVPAPHSYRAVATLACC
jgi:type IV pilus assembly protein PilV